MARILDIADGYTSSIAPTLGTIASTELKAYVDDAAYVSANGAAAAGDLYFNTTLDLVRCYDGSAWYSMPDDADVVHDTGDETIAGDKTFSDDVIVQGNLTVNGTQTILNTETLEVEDANVVINNGGNDVSAEGAGVTVERTGTNGAIVYADSATSKFKCGASGSEVEIATISGAQVFTAKDIDGLTASNTNRITLPKNTTTNLDGLTRKQGTIVYDTDLNKVKYDDGSALKAVGSGSGGGAVVNYLQDKVIGDWTTYDDAAAVPVDLTGGSPTGLTAANETTNPLFGTNSWKFSKDAANRQGMGWATSMTIKTGSLGLMHSLSNLYYFTSANYADDDITLYLYNVDQSQLVYFTPYQIKASTVPSKMFPSAQAQLLYNATLASADEYRLGIHIASTNANSYDLTICSAEEGLNFGPTQYNLGAVVTDWKDFTPTGAWTTNTTYTGSWKRVGDTAFYDIKVSVSGAPNSATLSVNLPSGHIIDTAKIKNSTANVDASIGHSTIWDNSGAIIPGGVGYVNTTSVQPRDYRVDAIPAYSTAISEAAPITFAASDFVHLTFSAPILGWSSSTQMSDEGETRRVGVTAHRAGTDQTGVNPNNTTVQLTMTSTALTNGIGDDTHARWNAGGYYDILISGKYRPSGSLFLLSTNIINGGVYSSRILVGASFATATEYASPDSRYGVTGQNMILKIDSAGLNLVAGDRVWIGLYGSGNNSASTLTLYGVKALTNFSLDLIQGPSAIAASSKIFLQYTGNAGTSITAGTTNIDFANKVVDPNGAWDGTTFTAPRSDMYFFNGQYKTTAALATLLHIYVGGTKNIKVGGLNGAVSSLYLPFNGGIYLTAGQTATIRSDTAGTLSNSSTDHVLTITSQGGV